MNIHSKFSCILLQARIEEIKFSYREKQLAQR